MKLATSAMISGIDEFVQKELGISILELMDRSGTAIANAIRDIAPKDKYVVILAGKGNNGGDGYAAAVKLFGEYDITVYDVFSAGQRSEEGQHFLKSFLDLGGSVINFQSTPEVLSHIKNAGCIVDAVFGTGFHGEIPEEIALLAIAVREAVEAQKIAIDVPLGVNADNGSVSEYAISVGATVELSYIKPGIISYPARSYVGKIIYDDLDIPKNKIARAFKFRHYMLDEKWVLKNLPLREENSHKGSFGKLLVITGSKKYRGASHLALEGALRGGAGLVCFTGEKTLVSELSQKYPEVIYNEIKEIADFDTSDAEELVKLSSTYSATLIGSGSDNTDGLRRLTRSLLAAEGGPLILDADAINALALDEGNGVLAIKNSSRKVIITPHPLEFARLSGTDVADVQLHRIEVAEKFAKENSCIVVLKGAGTVVTDGNEIFINVAGSSALAKAGSGDVLAGVLASLVAEGGVSPLRAAALAVCFHAKAGEVLGEELSTYGVTPSDLPREIARIISECEHKRKELKL